MILNKLSKYFSQQKCKNEGAIAFTAIILSGLIISVGIGMVAILAREIQFTSDLVISERSYFAAESGVEIALAELKLNPVENVVDEEINLGNSYAYLNIENSLDSFELELKPLETRKFRLKVDSDETLGDNFEAVSNFSITRLPEEVPFWWKIICQKQVINPNTQDEESSTIALQSIIPHKMNKALNDGMSGVFDNGKGDIQRESNGDIKLFSITQFLEYLETDKEKQSCFLSLTNLANSDPEKPENIATFTIGGDSKIAPYRAKISSVGKVSKEDSNKYQKTINFSTEQEGLSSFFDFGLYQK